MAGNNAKLEIRNQRPLAGSFGADDQRRDFEGAELHRNAQICALFYGFTSPVTGTRKREEETYGRAFRRGRETRAVRGIWPFLKLQNERRPRIFAAGQLNAVAVCYSPLTDWFRGRLDARLLQCIPVIRPCDVGRWVGGIVAMSAAVA